MVIPCFEKLVDTGQQDREELLFFAPVIEIVYSHFRGKLL